MSIRDRVRIEKEEVLSESWGTLRRTTLGFRRRDGAWQTLVRETYGRDDGVAILLFDPERRTVVLTRQFRLPAFAGGHDDLLLEVPAGLLDDAAPAERIRLEVEEETGFRVRDVEPVFEAFMSPGSFLERLHFFVGRYSPSDRVSEGGGHASEGEDIEVLELPFDEAFAMIATGAIRDAKTIMLLQHAALHLMPGAGGAPAGR